MAAREEEEEIMDLDLLDLYGRASDWTSTKVVGATSQLDEPTTCDGWDVRTLLNHMLQTQRYFVGAARGEDVAPPGGTPPDVLSDEPPADFARARAETLETFGEPGVIDKTGPAIAIAFSDQLLHGWDLARSTGQEATMPDGLPDAAYSLIHGRFTDEQRQGIFKPEVPVGPDASAQDRLLAYTGRNPLQSE
jgi:uncharacterized protein (TIGR03086 family)